MASFILPAAIRAVKSRIGIWRAYDQVVAIVPEVSREEWARAIGEARSALAQRVLESTRPLNRRPTASEMSPALDWKGGGAYLQRATIYVRDRETGARSAFTYNIRTDSLRSRFAIVGEAVDKLTSLLDEKPDDYPVDIIGFEYTGTYPIVPKR